jgi:predicted dehydrogenase
VVERAPIESQPLRVGIVGAGNVTVNGHIPAYQQLLDLFRIVALADPTEERLRLAGDLLQLPAADRYRDAADLIARSDVDIVDVSTPQHLHHDLVIAAVEAGRHVLCEKPIATTPRDGVEMIAAAKQVGVTFGVVHNYLFRPEVEAAVAALRAGRIGRVDVAILNYLGVVDYPGTAVFRPGWRHDARAAGGGVLMDMLHIVYVAEAILGARFDRVSAFVTAREQGSTVEDIALCRFEAGNAVALVNVGWGHGAGGIEVSGSEGRLSIRFAGGGTSPFAPVESITIVDREGEHHVTVAPERNGLVELLADFAHAILERRAPAGEGARALHALESTLAAYASGVTGRMVELPLSPGDPMYEFGALGVAQLDLPAWSPVRTRGLFDTSAGGVR